MTVLPWFVISAMVTANALFVAAEFSAVAAQRGEIARLADGGNPRARGLLAVLEDGAALDRYIAACQIGITISSLVAGAYGQATIAVELGPWLGAASAALVVLIVLTVLQVVLGELVPKSLALQYPERAALLTYLPIRWSVSVLRPFIGLLNGSGFLLLRPFGIEPGGHQHVHSPEEIGLLIAETSRSGALAPDLSPRLQRGLALSARSVRDVMVPRDAIFAVEVSTPSDEILRRVHESPYSRVVVYRGTLDEVLGTVGTKDIVAAYAENGSVPLLPELVKPLPTVRDDEGAVPLVRALQACRSSKALVVDERGRVQGFVSVHDVLDHLFGEPAAQEVR